jgi:hypothetical protein
MDQASTHCNAATARHATGCSTRLITRRILDAAMRSHSAQLQSSSTDCDFDSCGQCHHQSHHHHDFLCTETCACACACASLTYSCSFPSRQSASPWPAPAAAAELPQHLMTMLLSSPSAVLSKTPWSLLHLVLLTVRVHHHHQTIGARGHHQLLVASLVHPWSLRPPVVVVPAAAWAWA